MQGTQSRRMITAAGFILAACIIGLLYAFFFLPGTIYLRKDTTWTEAQSPYLITKKVVIPQGITLRIQPGATLHFQPGTGLTTKRPAGAPS